MEVISMMIGNRGVNVPPQAAGVLTENQPRLASKAPANTGTSTTTGATANSLSPENNWLSKIARSDEAAGNRLAKDFAYSYDMPLVDITDFGRGTGPVRYVATGRPVTEESTRAFNSEAAKLRESRIQIFESESAKGTSGADILDKIRSYMDNNASSDYLSLIQWDRISGRSG
jgi:hypothetical protein